MDTQSLYIQLGQLAENVPNFRGARPFPAATLQWLARLYALLSKAGHADSAAQIKNLSRSMSSSASDMEIHEVQSILYRFLALAELESPAPTHGAFIPVGNAFDALTAVGKVFREAHKDLLVVDPYLDEKVLTDFALQVREGVSIRLLSDTQGYKATLRPAITHWVTQYGSTRPLSARLAPPRSLHDRLVVTDDSKVWVLTQSLNAFATRSPASITRSDDETTALKVGAYKLMWDSAAPL